MLLLGLPQAFYNQGLVDGHSAWPPGPHIFHLALMAATIIPMFFIAAWAVRDLAKEERLAEVAERLAAGCCLLALLPMFHWELHPTSDSPP